VDVTVRRDNREQTLKVTAEKAPLSFGGIRIQQPEVSVLKDRINRSLSDLVWVSSSTAQAGIRVDSLTPQLREFFGVKGGAGVLVASVEQDSSAAKSGLRAGDVIMAVDGTTVSTPAEFTRALRRPSTPFVLQVVRDKLERDIRVQ
jgi:S1-C subfamily serine protease